MPKRLSISLVIPVYNEADCLGDCLRAVFAQSRPFDEIIVVDNNSTDTTAAIAAQFPGVRLMRESRQGIVYARTRGFTAAKGEIIARIDADTILPLDWAEHVREFYENPRNAATAWTSSGVFRDVPAPRLVSGGYRLVSVHINRWLTGFPTLWGSSMALPKSLWQRVANETCKGRDFHEDLDLATHLYRAGYKIFWDKRVRVSALLRHAWVTPRELWEYLQWWPATLRRHHQRTWLFCWLGGTFAMFGATLALAVCQRLRERRAVAPAISGTDTAEA